MGDRPSGCGFSREGCGNGCFHPLRPVRTSAEPCWPDAERYCERFLPVTYCLINVFCWWMVHSNRSRKRFCGVHFLFACLFRVCGDGIRVPFSWLAGAGRCADGKCIIMFINIKCFCNIVSILLYHTKWKEKWN